MNLLLKKLGALPAPETETVTDCPLCGNSRQDFVYEAFDRLHQLPGSFGIVRCQDCSLVLLSPRPLPENLSYYYPEDSYYSYKPAADQSQKGLVSWFRGWVRKLVLSRFGYRFSPLNVLEKAVQPVIFLSFKSRGTYGWGDRFPKYVPDGKALDIGCGSGIYLSRLKALGWDVSGVELSKKAGEAAKEQFDIDVFCGDIQDLPHEDNTFDHIHINHALEHFPDPFKLLKKVKDLLKPGGTLYIEVPNVESHGAKAAGPYWLHWDAPRHLFGFTPRSLEKTVSDSGLEVSTIATLLADFRDWEDTYRCEEELGSMLVDRPQSSVTSKCKHLPDWIRAKFAFYLDRNQGDFLCCWATKRKADGTTLESEKSNSSTTDA